MAAAVPPELPAGDGGEHEGAAANADDNPITINVTAGESGRSCAWRRTRSAREEDIARP